MAWNCSQNLQQQQQKNLQQVLLLPPTEASPACVQTVLASCFFSISFSAESFPHDFLFEIRKFHCSLLWLPCSFGLFTYLCGHVHATVCMEAKGQLPGVDFLLLPCGARGWALQGLYLLNHLGTLLFPFLWGILLSFFLHVLQKAWFGPEWEAQYGLFLNLGFPPLPNQGPRAGITSEHHRAVCSRSKVLVLAWKPSLTMQIRPFFSGFDQDARLKVQFPFVEPDQSQRKSWPRGQRVLSVS